MRNRSFPAPLMIGVLLFALLTGCASIGPRTLDRDQLDYGRSVGENWKDQMLANLVRMRFVDMPVFVDVGQIVSGYSLETTVTGALGFGTTLGGGDSQSLGAGGRYTDRPTITYMPKTGENFLRSLLTPIEPDSLLALMAAGYSPELLFTWAVESVNGLKNFSGIGKTSRLPDPTYYEFVDLLLELQKSGTVAFEVRKDEGGQSVLFTFSDRNMSDDLRAKREKVRSMLGLDPDRAEFRVTYSPFSQSGDLLALQTRSILQILSAMAGFVDVPPGKVAWAAKGYELSPGSRQPFTVHTSAEAPDNAFASFHYQGDWYWIANDDIDSKRVFTFMLFVTTLTNTGGNGPAPVLTIPTS